MPMGNTTCDDDDDDDDDLLLPLFSEDVLIQILVWLPVISLLRFKSVCKSWRAFIESPFFIDLHTTTTPTFNSSSSSSKFGSFILHANPRYPHEREQANPRYPHEREQKMFMLSSGSGSGSGGGGEWDTTGDDDIIDNDDQADYLGFPPYSKDSLPLSVYIRMVGSCNGLICIQDKKLRNVTLWNPATGHFRILPKSITIEEKEEDEVMGKFLYDFVAFGFDVKTKDYKVVQFSCFRPPLSYLHRRRGEECFCLVQVYCLSTDSWRLLEGINSLPVLPSNLPYQNQGIYLNGCYFFVGKDESQVWQPDGSKILVCNNSLMYSFDFTKEILTTMQFPDHDSRHDLILGYLGEKMALFIIRRNLFIGGGSEFHDCELDYEYYDIWVLNEQHGSGSSSSVVVNKESWTKLHSFRKINILKHPSQPRCISNNGEFALISTRTPRGFSKLQLFNLVTKEAIKDFPNGNGVLRSDVYKQSLVSIIGGNGAAATMTLFAHATA